MSSKNLGQVAGVHIGKTPPENIILIWYDDNIGQKCHKVYNVELEDWTILDNILVSIVTYDELVAVSNLTGLTLNSKYIISDRGNVLATAVKTNVVFYFDTNNNLLVDDLGSFMQYIVTAANFKIENISGVIEDGVLKFDFQEVLALDKDDFVLFKVKNSDPNPRFLKTKVSKIISSKTDNSIKWDGGAYFNFAQAVMNIVDKENGVVSFNTYHENMSTILSSLETLNESLELVSSRVDDLELDMTDVKEVSNNVNFFNLITTIGLEDKTIVVPTKASNKDGFCVDFFCAKDYNSKYISRVYKGSVNTNNQLFAIRTFNPNTKFAFRIYIIQGTIYFDPITPNNTYILETTRKMFPFIIPAGTYPCVVITNDFEWYNINPNNAPNTLIFVVEYYKKSDNTLWGLGVLPDNQNSAVPFP